MRLLNYIHASDLTPSLEEAVVSGEHITVDKVRYERVKSKPIRKKLMRTLINEDQSTTIRIFG